MTNAESIFKKKMYSIVIIIRWLLICFVVILFSLTTAIAQNAPEFRNADRYRIKEALNIANVFSDSVWAGWSEVPMTVLLVTDSLEYLINHNTPTDDFKSIGYDSLLQSEIYYRPRVFEINVLATFPAVNGVPTIVVGTPENTGKSTSAWIVILLHEHFHQYQDLQLDYFTATQALDLHGGDETGMWMLNYPFPYKDENVNILYDKMKKALVSIFDDGENFNEKLNKFLVLRNEFKNLLSEKDYKYFSLQVWQEGIARYTELEIANFLSKYNYQPSEKVKQMDDFINFKELSIKLFTKERNLLNGLKLKESHRNCFYPFGAFEGKLLDKLNKDWKKKYIEKMFFLEKYYE